MILFMWLLACGPVKSPENMSEPVVETEAVTTPEPAPAPKESEEHRTSRLTRQINGAVASIESKTNVERAIAQLKQVLRETPNDAFAHFNLGVAYVHQNNVTKARVEFERATTLDKSMGEAWWYLGVLQERAFEQAKALQTMKTGIRHAPESLELRVAYLTLLRRSGQAQQAIEVAKEALALNANSLPVYNNLGLAYLELGDTDMARFVFLKALNSVPGAEDDAELRTNVGWLYYKGGEKGPGLYHLQAAVKLDSKGVLALSQLAQAYMDERNYEDALPLLESAKKVEPLNHGILMDLGVVYRGVGRLSEAKASYEKALQVNALDSSPWFNLGILYSEHLHDYDRAMKSFSTYIDMGGTHVSQAQVYLLDAKKLKKKADKRKKRDQGG